MSKGVPQPGNGFLGWLGRQVGHVSKAVKADVVAPPPSVVVHREVTVDEHPMPGLPGVTLRRTTIDEAVIQSKDLDPVKGSA